MNRQEEFPLNVEGGKTAPYASTVASVDQEAGQVLLKLIRPLPAQLPMKTPCKVAITAFGEHWRAILVFQGRRGHLQYLFDLPSFLEKAGRREHKRYRFRPREDISVYVQDSSLPGICAIGKLLDISMGGLSFKPERAYRVEDKGRVALGTALFERGKSFPIIRVDGLREIGGPLRLRGTSAYVGEKKSALTAAFVFGLLDPETEHTLETVLESREKMAAQGSAAAPLPKPPSHASHQAKPFYPDESAYPNPSGETRKSANFSAGLAAEPFLAGQEPTDAPPTILRLARRACRLLLVKHGGEECDKIISALKIGGFVRVEHCESLESHLAQTIQKVDALLVGLEVGGDVAAPIDSFRSIHEKLQARAGQKAMVLSEKFEPALSQLSKDYSLPIGFTHSRNWMEDVDKAVGLL